jgi:outer membrane receptor protein involved in Fe transport
MSRRLKIFLAVIWVLLVPISVRAGGIPGATVELGPVIVAGEKLIGDADSATIGTVYSEQFENRPISRPGEILEVVPGLIVTQHSGEGKANQYFLRGYNLDHGTDFAVTIDGFPVNAPSHAHGQGYADTGFFIPELVDAIVYRKGPYYAEYGDFSAAGAADIRYKEHFDRNVVEGTGGEYGYGRVLAAGSFKLGLGEVVYGTEYVHYDGPYDLKESFNKGNVVLRYSQKYGDGSFHFSTSGYSSRNASPDQVPERAVAQGAIGEFGFLDPTDGGHTLRINAGGGLEQRLGRGKLSFNAYAFRYQLELFSNFTYFLDDPVNGDQFNQSDRRNVYGGALSYSLPSTLFGLSLDSTFGIQTRYDDIGQLGLYRTVARKRIATTSVSSVREFGGAAYAQTSLRLARWLRFTAGTRVDYFNFDIQNNISENSGDRSAKLISPKGALIFGPFKKTEFFLNAGQGYHSNDGRGTTEHRDPTTGDPAEPVTPLAPARGVDFGIRTALIPSVQITASVFRLSAASELVYSGDAGTTEPTGATVRYGGELAIYAKPIQHFVLDADFAYTSARYKDSVEIDDTDGRQIAFGKYVPQAIQGVAALGLTYASPEGWDVSLRARYFGPRPLREDNGIRSNSTTVINIGAGYQLTKNWRVSGQITNLFNSRDHDIDYYYASRLQGETATGVNDIHFHPIEPINLRITINYTY